MAKHLGLKKLFVKDESYRFGLNAFKVLGGSYAIGRYIAQKTGKDISEVTYDYLTSDKLKEEFGQTTFYTATDGNHGRGIAWAANKLGQKCDIIMFIGKGNAYMHTVADAVTEGFNEGILEQRPNLVNLQCDIDHPTQAMADCLHLINYFGGIENLKGKKVAMT